MTTTDLLKVFHDHGLSEVAGLNLLQSEGIISDLCIWATDVAESDIPNAVAFIKQQHEKSQN